MEISIISDPIEGQTVDHVVIPYFEKSEQLNGSANHLNKLVNESISKLISFFLQKCIYFLLLN